MISLSNRRQADNNQVIVALEKDEKFLTAIQSIQNQEQIDQIAQYITEGYSCDENMAQEAIDHFIRRFRKAKLSNRLAQSTIVIPPTTDHPIGKTIPVAKTNSAPKPQVTVDATPAATPEEKEREVEKPFNDESANRQQRIINSVRSLKLIIQELSRDMYEVPLTDEHCGKVVDKVIDQIGTLSGQQTSDTVRSLVSPLLGGV